jgi:hypothetical protein
MERGLEPFFREVVATRERWATLTNTALREAHIDAHVDHRSLEAQGVDREPRPHLPRPVYEMERRGESNALAERMRAEHGARVEARLQRAATVSEHAATASAAPKRDATPTLAPAASLEEVRRQARENWLKMRSAQLSGVEPARARESARSVQPDRGHDDDLGR